MATRQRAEAVGKLTSPATGLTVLWSDTRFTLPRAEDFPLEALEAEEEGKHLTALKLILGAGQYTVWRALASTAADAEEFSAAVMKELGRENLNGRSAPGRRGDRRSARSRFSAPIRGRPA
jgi:hypothetical protein